MSRAYMLKNTPFSIGYDLPKEIKEARKKLWDDVKRIRQTSPRIKFQIVYRAGRDDVTTGKLFPSRGECLGLYSCVLIIFKRK